MNLFVFGFGYVAQRLVDVYADDFKQISWTVRHADKRNELRSRKLDAYLFDAIDQNPGISSRIKEADVLLVSVPPGRSGDPVLLAFSPQIVASVARRIVYLSTVGVYGDHGGAWIDENTPPSPEVDRAKARLTAEENWKDLAGKRLAILRLASIYGPGRNPLARLREGNARRIVKPGQVFNRIHVDDAARATMGAIRRAAGGLWNVCDDEPAPPQEVIAYAAKLMKRPIPREQEFDTAEMTPMARSFYGTNNRVSNARLKSELGVELAYPTYRDGLEHLWNSSEGR
jgi:dTDP-4-dehydrorhamnose reductase